MEKKKQRRSTGGQPIRLSEAQLAVVRKLCLCHCTIAEIASIMELTERTLYYWLASADHPFTIAYHAARAEGKILIRQLQFQSANRGCVEMLKLLGKQYLGQSEQPQTVVNVSTTTGLKTGTLTAEQQKDLERLYADIQKRALSRAKREMESGEWP